MVDMSYAAAHLDELITRVMGGEEFTITREGSPVARLIPVVPEPIPEAPEVGIERRRQAILTMREIASHNRLDGLSISELRAEGRR